MNLIQQKEVLQVGILIQKVHEEGLFLLEERQYKQFKMGFTEDV